VISKEFEQRLCATFDAYQRGLKAAWAEMATDSRGGAITALQTVIEFTDAITTGNSQSHTLPLTALLSALNDLDSGRVGPMLKPKKGVDNRKPDAGFRKVQRAAAIFSVDQLITAGMKVEDACKIVAALLQKGGMPIEGRFDSPAWRTVRGWRYDATKRRADDQEANALATLRAECAIPDGTPLEQVKEVIARIMTSFLKGWSRGLG
jgi:hypothetical protein